MLSRSCLTATRCSTYAICRPIGPLQVGFPVGLTLGLRGALCCIPIRPLCLQSRAFATSLPTLAQREWMPQAVSAMWVGIV